MQPQQKQQQLVMGGCCPPRPTSFLGGALPLQTSPVKSGNGQNLDTALVVVLAGGALCFVWWWCFGGGVFHGGVFMLVIDGGVFMVVIGGVCWWGWWVVFCCVLSCFVVFLWCVLDGALWWEAPPATPRANLCWGAAAPQTPLSSWRGSAPPDLPCESRSWPASGYSFGGGTSQLSPLSLLGCQSLQSHTWLQWHQIIGTSHSFFKVGTLVGSLVGGLWTLLP